MDHVVAGNRTEKPLDRSDHVFIVVVPYHIKCYTNSEPASKKSQSDLRLVGQGTLVRATARQTLTVLQIDLLSCNQDVQLIFHLLVAFYRTSHHMIRSIASSYLPGAIELVCIGGRRSICQ